MIKRLSRALLCAVVIAAALIPVSVTAQDVTPTPIPLNIEADLYNHESGWHIRIPAGWTNESTDDYARFTLNGETIFASESAETNAGDAMRETIIEAGLAPALESNSYSALTLNNGQWTQLLFDTNPPGTVRVSAHAQQYEDRFYVLLYITTGEANALPIVVAYDNVAQSVSGAARQYDPGLSVLPDQVPVNPNDAQRATVTIERPNGDPLNVVARTISSNTFVMLGTASQADLVERSIYFTLLNDFFITPNTQPYLILGLALGFGVLAILIVSLIVRYQNLKRDEAALNQVAGDT